MTGIVEFITGWYGRRRGSREKGKQEAELRLLERDPCADDGWEGGCASSRNSMRHAELGRANNFIGAHHVGAHARRGGTCPAHILKVSHLSRIYIKHFADPATHFQHSCRLSLMKIPMG